MRKKISYIAIGFLVLLCINLTSSSLAAIDTTVDPVFEYGIAEGDELQYNIVTDLNIVASDNFYSEVGDLLTTTIETQAEMSVFASNFSLKLLVQDLEAYLREQIKTKLIIADMYNIDSNLTDGLSIDYITGDLRMNVNGEWTLPTDYLVAKANNLSTVLAPHLDAAFYTNYLEPQLAQVSTLTENYTEANFNDLPLVQNIYFDNLTDTIGLANAPSLADGTPFPALPNNHYLPGVANAILMDSSSGPGAMGLCFPTDFSFKAYYDWAISAYDFMKTWTVENEKEFPLVDYTIPELFAMFGVSTYHVNDQSVGITWASNQINFHSLADLIGFNESEVLGTIEDAFSNISLIYDDSSVTLSMALEYDDEMVLASYCFYADIIIAINGATIPAEIGFNLGNEVVEVHWVQSIVKDGLVAPTEAQIQNGELGENRDMNPQTSSPFNIPGYSLALLGLISVTAVLTVLKRVKRQ